MHDEWRKRKVILEFKPGDKVLVDTIKGKIVYEVLKAESYDFTYDEYCYELKNYDGEYTGEDESDLELYVKKRRTKND